METDLRLISFQDGSSIETPTPPDLGGRSLVISVPPGRLAALRAIRVHPADSETEPAVWARLRRLAVVDARALRRPLAGARQGDRVVVLSEAPEGPSLRTVLRLVPLTWDQAVVLGEGLLSALSRLQPAELVHGDITSDTVVLGGDGRVRLIDPALTPPGQGELEAGHSDVRQAAGLLSELLARVPPPSLRSVPDDVQAALLQVAGELAQGGVPATKALASWRRAVRPALDRSGRTRVVRQLQALAVRLPGVPATLAVKAARTSGTAADLGASAPIAPPSPAPAPGASVIASSGPQPGWRERHSAAPEGGLPPGRRGRWVAAAILVVLVAAGGGALLVVSHGNPRAAPRRGGGPGTATTVPVNPTTASPSAAAASPTPSPSSPARPNQLQPIPYLGPAADPPVQQVQLEAGCAPSGLQGCQVTLTADLGQHSATTVMWKIDVVDRCDGDVTTVASGQIPAPAAYTYVQTQPQVTLPSGVPVALVGLAGAFGQAASLPLLINPLGSRCPG
ncbi:MAG: serine/threonine-protein kinase [Candidatus Dormibacteria bacterium]